MLHIISETLPRAAIKQPVFLICTPDSEDPAVSFSLNDIGRWIGAVAGANLLPEKPELNIRVWLGLRPDQSFDRALQVVGVEESFEEEVTSNSSYITEKARWSYDESGVLCMQTPVSELPTEELEIQFLRITNWLRTVSDDVDLLIGFGGRPTLKRLHALARTEIGAEPKHLPDSFAAIFLTTHITKMWTVLRDGGIEPA